MCVCVGGPCPPGVQPGAGSVQLGAGAGSRPPLHPAISFCIEMGDQGLHLWMLLPDSTTTRARSSWDPRVPDAQGWGGGGAALALLASSHPLVLHVPAWPSVAPTGITESSQPSYTAEWQPRPGEGADWPPVAELGLEPRTFSHQSRCSWPRPFLSYF